MVGMLSFCLRSGMVLGKFLYLSSLFSSAIKWNMTNHILRTGSSWTNCVTLRSFYWTKCTFFCLFFGYTSWHREILVSPSGTELAPSVELRVLTGPPGKSWNEYLLCASVANPFKRWDVTRRPMCKRKKLEKITFSYHIQIQIQNRLRLKYKTWNIKL